MVGKQHDPVLVWRAIVNPPHINAVLGGPPDDDTAHALLQIVLDVVAPAATSSTSSTGAAGR